MDDVLNPMQEYAQTLTSLSELRSLFKVSSDPANRRSLSAKIKRLESYQNQLESLYSLSPDQIEDEPEPPESNEEFPIFAELADRYNRSGEIEYLKDKEARAAFIFLHYFENEFLGIFNRHVMKLDVEYSIARDSFYGKFQPLSKSAKDYREEYRYIETGEFSPERKHAMRGRLLEKKHYLLIEMVRFFQMCREFAADLIADIDTDGILCQNGLDTVSLTSYEGTPELQGQTVRYSLVRLRNLADEIIAFMNLPEFT